MTAINRLTTNLWGVMTVKQPSKDQPITEGKIETPTEKVINLPAPFVFTRLPVRLPAYEGSAELLLWLLRRQLVEVGDVTVKEIAKQVGAIHPSPSQKADELAVAAELTWLKSALLLPQPEPEALEAGGEEALEGEPFRRRLLRNAAYGLVAKFLAERGKVWSQMFPRPSEEAFLQPLKEVVLHDEPTALLVEAMRRVLNRMAGLTVRLPRRRLTVPQRLRMVLQMLRASPEGALTFEVLCYDCETLLEVVITFLALLELIRRGVVGARQDEPFAPIVIFLKRSKKRREKVEG